MSATKYEVSEAIYILLDRIIPMLEENKCKDFDEDCPGNGGPTNCWLHDPCQGWCPLISKENRKYL